MPENGAAAGRPGLLLALRWQVCLDPSSHRSSHTDLFLNDCVCICFVLFCFSFTQVDGEQRCSLRSRSQGGAEEGAVPNKCDLFEVS